MDYASQTPADLMREVAGTIILVRDDTKPRSELIEKYKKYADLGVSTRKHEEWYCLLRKTQGDLFQYNNDLRHMIDSHMFLADSLFCEWAYIVNLDTEKLEVFRGFNQDRHAPGRYARLLVSDNNGYRGVALIRQIPFANIQNSSLDDIVRELGDIGYATQPVR